MVTEKKITSLHHSQVFHWTQLLKKRAYRQENGTVLVSGKRLILELAQKRPLHALMTVDKAPEIWAENRFLVTESILKRITGLEAPDGYAAELDLPPPQDLSHCKRLLVLDGISDPGNLGTLLRTAYALGWEGVVATPGSVDFFNDKALRAAKGATFYLPYAWAPSEEIMTWKTSFFIADIEGEPLSEVVFHPPFALVLSSETKGPGRWTEILGKKIHIPMQGGAESLNVAAAGAILLYAMRPL